ncbi:MAG: hypothetical protein ACK5O7_02900 [Holosporales bacterium]
MPQLDVATYASQLFWLGLCFIVLLIGSVGIYLPRMSRILDTRWQHIEGTFSEAEALRKEAEELHRVSEQLLAEARETANRQSSEISRQVAIELSKKKSESMQRFKERMRHADVLITERKAAAMGSVQEVAEAITHEVIEKILPGIDQKDIATFVRGAMERKRNNGR